MTAVAERPVTKIFAAVAGFFAVRRVADDRVGVAVSAALFEDRAVTGAGGGGGRSGSFSISRHPRRRDPRRRDPRHHGLRHDGLCRDFRPHPRRSRHRLDEGEFAAVMGESRR